MLKQARVPMHTAHLEAEMAQRTLNVLSFILNALAMWRRHPRHAVDVCRCTHFWC